MPRWTRTALLSLAYRSMAAFAVLKPARHPHHMVSGLAQCSFVLRPACSLTPSRGLLHQGLRTFHCFHARLGCYRLERKLPGGFCALPLEFCAFVTAHFNRLLGTAGFCLMAPAAWVRACGLGDLETLRWFLPISALVVGVGQALRSWCARVQCFQATSQAQIARSLAVCASQTLGGFGGFREMGLIAGIVIGDCVLAATLARSTLARRARLFWVSCRWQALRRIAWRVANPS